MYAANLTAASVQGGNCLKDRVGKYMEGSFGSISAGIVGGVGEGWVRCALTLYDFIALIYGC